MPSLSSDGWFTSQLFPQAISENPVLELIEGDHFHLTRLRLLESLGHFLIGDIVARGWQRMEEEAGQRSPLLHGEGGGLFLEFREGDHAGKIPETPERESRFLEGQESPSSSLELPCRLQRVLH